MSKSEKKKVLFERFRKSLNAAGLSVEHEGCLICPLCWRETHYDLLSLEHFIPGSVGGKRCVLTCEECNSSHGSRLDAHLSKFQAVRDAFEGRGTIPGELKMHGHRATINIQWGSGHKNIDIVRKASDPAAIAAMQNSAQSGDIGEMGLTLNYGYSKDGFQTALLRCAYLAIFKCYGYEYARHEVVQVIRRRISDPSLRRPRLGSLIGRTRGEIPRSDPYFVVPGQADGVDFLLVIVRLLGKTKTYHFVFMPMPSERCNEFYDVMERVSADPGHRTFTIPYELGFT